MKEIFENVKLLSEDLKKLNGIDEVQKSSNATIIMENTYELMVTDEGLKKKTYELFKDGYHARAVEEAFKYLDNLVYKNAKLKNGLTGDGLMRNVFSPNNPILMINDNISESEKSEQRGYMDIMAGSMSGIRNPRAHDSDWEDTEERALQLLGLANHLIVKVRNSIYNRK